MEKNGEAWYVNPSDNKRYYLGRPADAFNVMRKVGLGVKDGDLNSIAKVDVVRNYKNELKECYIERFVIGEYDLKEDAMNVSNVLASNCESLVVSSKNSECYIETIDRCYAQLGEKTGNESICEKISSNELRDDCVDEINNEKNKEKVSSMLSFSVDGRPVILVTSPDGQQNGISANDELFQDNDNVEMYRTGDGMFVSLPSPISGDYQVSVSGELSDVVSVDSSFISAEIGGLEFDVSLFLDGDPSIFIVHVDLLADYPVVLKMDVIPLYDLTAISGEDDKTKLIWETMGDQQVSSYNIYSKSQADALYTLLETVSGNSLNYQTDYLVEPMRRLYSVSVVDVEGRESVLSDVVSR